MTAAGAWTGIEPLPTGRVTLLEASAGTGKTWQIEGLVTRLVAEYGLAIERILVITFTNAAAAELRDRVRRRLVRAREALGCDQPPADDPILEWLWRPPEQRDLRLGRLTDAVSAFDQAPISTIHSFSQRMLDQLAFESGQEPGLELLVDPAPLLERLVDDELARVYAEADLAELAILTDMGWTKDRLAAVARAMTRAVAPEVEPLTTDSEPGGSLPLEPVRAWRRRSDDLLAWLSSTDGEACVRALRRELERAGRGRLRGMNRGLVGRHLRDLRAWLEGPALRSHRVARPEPPAWARLLVPAHLEASWTGVQTTLGRFAGAELFRRVGELFEAQDRLWSQALAGFAARARETLDAELVRTGRVTYDTMLSRLADRIAEQGGGEGQLARSIRSRFDAALVDEFQDTDGAQWPVMRAVFDHPERRLLLIGDPKQAIYSFRGADVHVYLDAARLAGSRATMRTSWRSDRGFVAAMNHLWAEGSSAFDLEEIDYLEVDPPRRSPACRVRGLPDEGDRPRRPLELRWVDGETLRAAGRVVGTKAAGQDACARLAALEAARLLSGGVELHVQRPGASEPGWSRLQPGDLAVLVRTNDQAERIRLHLERLGLPCVSAGRGSVLESPALEWLCAWLDAVADPGRDRPARALATTPLFGWTATDLAVALAATDAVAAGDPTAEQRAAADRWDAWLASVRAWAEGWRSRGFVRVFEQALDEQDVVRRLLGARQGERYATDLRHLVELGHAQERRTRTGPAGLASWLRSARQSSGAATDDARALRLESDAHAIQLVTIHRSKGLEYPVVLLPFGWADVQPSDGGGPLEWHARVGDRTRVRLNLAPADTPSRRSAAERAAREERQEQLRLLYVALTRARHHCVAWLGPLGRAGADTGSHALGRIALRQRDEAGRPAGEPDCPDFPATNSRDPGRRRQVAAVQEALHRVVCARLDRLSHSSEETIGWSHEPPPEPPPSPPRSSADQAPLSARPWPGRSLRTPWQVSSYSALVSGRTFERSEPQRPDALRATAGEVPGGRGARVELPQPPPEAGLDRPIATAGLAGGTEVGTWAHAVLEHLDFQACRARDGRDLPALLAELGGRHGVRSAAQQQLFAAALPSILDTPLDGGVSGLPSGWCLRDLAPEHRVDELAFDLRLGEGSRWRGAPDRRSGRLDREGAGLALRSRLADPGWGGVGWLRAVLDRTDRQGAGLLPSIAGILTGFIDLVFRAPTDGDPETRRYFVCDYKTNRIGPTGDRRDSRWRHYTQPWMDWEMAHHGYHLQALLYTVALHRLLAARLPDYDYDRDVGGHLYLFVRGMAGADTPRRDGLPLGVYADRWPATVVLGLDAALSGATTDEVRAVIAQTGGGR